jgi:hypothetical protein
MRPAALRFASLVASILASLVASSSARAQGAAPPAALPPLPTTTTAATAAAPPPPPGPEAPPGAAAAAPAVPPGPTNYYVQTAPPSAGYFHHGFYLGVGAGAGFMTLWGHGPTGSASISGLGMVGDIGIGGTVAPGFVIGGVARAWNTTGTFNGGPPITATATYYSNGAASPSKFALSGNAHVATAELSLFVDWYPRPDDGWHIGASLGLGGTSMTDDAGTKTTSGALEYTLFGGYQWWLGPDWSLGLALVASSATSSGLADGDGNNTGYRLMPFAIGLESQLLYF